MLANIPDSRIPEAVSDAWNLLLSRHHRLSGKWGYNKLPPGDADSTGWALQLAASIGEINLLLYCKLYIKQRLESIELITHTLTILGRFCPKIPKYVGWVEGRNPTNTTKCWVSQSLNPTYKISKPSQYCIHS
jgi:hypothetical protein